MRRSPSRWYHQHIYEQGSLVVGRQLVPEFPESRGGLARSPGACLPSVAASQRGCVLKFSGFIDILITIWGEYGLKCVNFTEFGLKCVKFGLIVSEIVSLFCAPLCPMT